MRLSDLGIYLLTLIIFFLVLKFIFDLLKNKTILKRREKSKKFAPETRSFIDYSFNIKVDKNLLKIIILFIFFNTSIIYLLPWAYNLEKMGYSILFYGLIFLIILLITYLYILREKKIE